MAPTPPDEVESEFDSTLLAILSGTDIFFLRRPMPRIRVLRLFGGLMYWWLTVGTRRRRRGLERRPMPPEEGFTSLNIVRNTLYRGKGKRLMTVFESTTTKGLNFTLESVIALIQSFRSLKRVPGLQKYSDHSSHYSSTTRPSSTHTTTSQQFTLWTIPIIIMSIH